MFRNTEVCWFVAEVTASTTMTHRAAVQERGNTDRTKDKEIFLTIFIKCCGCFNDSSYGIILGFSGFKLYKCHQYAPGASTDNLIPVLQRIMPK